MSDTTKRFKLYDAKRKLVAIVTASSPSEAIKADKRAVVALWAPR